MLIRSLPILTISSRSMRPRTSFFHWSSERFSAMVSSPAGGTDEQAWGLRHFSIRRGSQSVNPGAAIMIPSTMMLKMMYGVAAR